VCQVNWLTWPRSILLGLAVSETVGAGGGAAAGAALAVVLTLWHPASSVTVEKPTTAAIFLTPFLVMLFSLFKMGFSQKLLRSLENVREQRAGVSPPGESGLALGQQNQQRREQISEAPSARNALAGP
jgi:hypothetical protein